MTLFVGELIASEGETIADIRGDAQQQPGPSGSKTWNGHFSAQGKRLLSLDQRLAYRIRLTKETEGTVRITSVRSNLNRQALTTLVLLSVTVIRPPVYSEKSSTLTPHMQGSTWNQFSLPAAVQRSRPFWRCHRSAACRFRRDASLSRLDGD